MHRGLHPTGRCVCSLPQLRFAMGRHPESHASWILVQVTREDQPQSASSRGKPPLMAIESKALHARMLPGIEQIQAAFARARIHVEPDVPEVDLSGLRPPHDGSTPIADETARSIGVAEVSKKK